MQQVGIGIIGCGNISSAYLKTLPQFPILKVCGVADLNADLAAARAAEFNVPARSIEDLYADPEIRIILNLTVPKAHVAVGLKALEAGKHVYSEKPLGVTFSEGKHLSDVARALGIRIGSAPDTFLGGAHQTARTLIDDGAIGQPIGGTAYFMCPGHERWHPNPDFYYEAGGGPMLDMGPYYITDLVNLLGPVEKVAGFATKVRDTRRIGSEPRRGEVIPVHVPTHVTGLMSFVNGAVVQISMSFDVAGHRHTPLEIYGTEATLIVPDPNHFGGDLFLLPLTGEAQGKAVSLPYAEGNWRSLGLADMAHAIIEDRPHRASGDLALHVLEVMEAFQTASDQGQTITITTRVERPAPLSESLIDGLLGR